MDFATLSLTAALSLCPTGEPVTVLWLSAAENLLPVARHLWHAPHFHTDSSSGPVYLAGRESAAMIDELNVMREHRYPFLGARSV